MSASGSEPVSMEVVRGTPDPEELAAAIAVVGEAYATEATTAPTEPPRLSRWERSARRLRGALGREDGWGGFAG